MNGQTGEFVGNMPLDKGKTVIFAVSLFVLIAGLVILITYLATGGIG